MTQYGVTPMAKMRPEGSSTMYQSDYMGQFTPENNALYASPLYLSPAGYQSPHYIERQHRLASPASPNHGYASPIYQGNGSSNDSDGMRASPIYGMN